MRYKIVFAGLVSLSFFSFFLFSIEPEPNPKALSREEPKGDEGPVENHRARYANIKTRPEYLAAVLSDPRFEIDSGVVRIVTSKKKGRIDYRFLFSDSSTQKGKAFMKEYGLKLAESQKKYGVSPNFITAVLKLESDFGGSFGKHLVVNSLYTIRLNSPKRKRFADKEFKSFLELSMKNEWDPFSIKSSWAGAFGIPQFMPSSFVYAVDGDGDGNVDLFDMDDAIMSVGNFLKKHGWGSNSKAQRKALESYNKGSYAEAVMRYAAMLKKSSDITPAKR